jgi:hypothetical protein
MDFSVCAQCGVEIENKGIHFRNHVFCSDECCEEYEAEFADKDEPIMDELMDDNLVPDDLDDDLGYRDEDLDDTLDDDDDFDIKPEDF